MNSARESLAEGVPLSENLEVIIAPAAWWSPAAARRRPIVAAGGLARR
ncbi:MAG: hypothetical protein HY423_06110 [Candidatus Lambdaproteobacteria bacterium]|nr:hypothetical protein [Candidatus Lambdaproteobacteria bacterium]